MNADRLIKVSLCGSGPLDIIRINPLFLRLKEGKEEREREFKRERESSRERERVQEREREKEVKLHGNRNSLSDFTSVNSEDMKSDDFLVPTLINDEFQEAGVVGTMSHGPFGGFEEGGINFDVLSAKSSIGLFLGETTRSVLKGSENGGWDVDIIHQTR